jgi:hypothetical protein
VAVNGSADLGLGLNDTVVDNTPTTLFDNNAESILTDGFVLTATGSMGAIAGKVDGSASGVIADVTQSAAGFQNISGVVDATIADFTLTTAQATPRNALSTSNIEHVVTVIGALYSFPSLALGGGGSRGDAAYIHRALEHDRALIRKRIMAQKKKAEREDDDEDDELTDEEFESLIQTLHEQQAMEAQRQRNALWSTLVSLSKH